MTLFANGKNFEGPMVRTKHSGSNYTGVAEIIAATVDFLASDNCNCLHLEFDTLSERMDDTSMDASHSSFHLTRTIAHNIPLRRASYVDANGHHKPLPIDWFKFLGSGISAYSKFSKLLVNTGSPDSEKEWQWRTLSFETEWRLPLPLLTDSQISNHSDSEGEVQG
jgi:hypothetical protein